MARLGVQSAANETDVSPSMAGGLALLAGLATLWGASYTFIKLGVATISPVTLIAARTLIAGGLLVAVMRARGLSLPRDGTTWTRCQTARSDDAPNGAVCCVAHRDRVCRRRSGRASSETPGRPAPARGS